jgi:hypothetical protein
VNRNRLLATALLGTVVLSGASCASSDDDGDPVDTTVTVDAPDRDQVRDDPRDPRSGFQGPDLGPPDTEPPTDESVPPL